MDKQEIDELIQKTAVLMQIFQNRCESLSGEVHKKLDNSLQQQRRELIALIREDVHNGLESALAGYSKQLEEAGKKINHRTIELEQYLGIVARKNKYIIYKSWAIVSISLTLLLIGGMGLSLYYQNVVRQNKIQADLLRVINESDLRVCGDYLCAAVGKEKQGKYRMVKKKE